MTTPKIKSDFVQRQFDFQLAGVKGRHISFDPDRMEAMCRRRVSRFALHRDTSRILPVNGGDALIGLSDGIWHRREGHAFIIRTATIFNDFQRMARRGIFIADMRDTRPPPLVMTAIVLNMP